MNPPQNTDTQVLHGSVRKVIPSVFPTEQRQRVQVVMDEDVELYCEQVVIDEAVELYCELSINNDFRDEHGQPVMLREGD